MNSKRESSRKTNSHPVGALLSAVVNRVSHGRGETLRIMAKAEVSLQQVLLLTRLAEAHPASATDLAGKLNLSLPAISQAVERLVRLRLVSRVEDLGDRRRKWIELTRKAKNLLTSLNLARSREYAAGLSGLNPETLAGMEALLREALHQLESISSKGA